MTTPDQRSSIAPEILQAVIDASGSAKAATLVGQQQYSTPTQWAELFASQLPDQSPSSVFDPQCAGGNLLNNGFAWSTDSFGWDIDSRFNDSYNHYPFFTRLTANCVTLWEILDDVFPDLRFECQVANPPFGIRWKLPKVADHGLRIPVWMKQALNTVDSTEYTWKKILERASPRGYGYFIANKATIERLKIHEHPFCYLYSRFPAGFFPGTVVEPGVVHWCAAHTLADGRTHIEYRTLDPKEHSATPLNLAFLRDWDHSRDRDATNSREIRAAFDTIQEVLDEERKTIPKWNVWLDDAGMLRTYLSTRTQVKRKLSREEIHRLSAIDKGHPLTFVVEAETRKLLQELTDSTFYTMSPEAKAAIEDALKQAKQIATPIMNVTPFERTAYADSLDNLLCKAAGGLPFTIGQWYSLRTATYTFVQHFKRQKVHFDESTQETFTAEHSCTLSGQDRYIALTDDDGLEHRFMDKPKSLSPAELEIAHRHRTHIEHEESLLWDIFEAPEVNTIAEAQPEQIKINRQKLKEIEERINEKAKA